MNDLERGWIMLERMVIVLLVYGSMLVYGIPRLKKASRKEQWIYASILFVTMYSASGFVMQKFWPNLDDLMHMFLGNIGNNIVNQLKRS
jgi:hypothetical protein